MTTKRYEIFVDDNFHYQDEDYRYKQGNFDTYDEAIIKCKKIVDESLEELLTPKMSAEKLIEAYVFFGDDPFIVPSEGNSNFSARDYASRRCQAICRKN